MYNVLVKFEKYRKYRIKKELVVELSLISTSGRVWVQELTHSYPKRVGGGAKNTVKLLHINLS